MRYANCVQQTKIAYASVWMVDQLSCTVEKDLLTKAIGFRTSLTIWKRTPQC
jgi:hypothetical protein